MKVSGNISEILKQLSNVTSAICSRVVGIFVIDFSMNCYIITELVICSYIYIYVPNVPARGPGCEFGRH